MILQNEGGKCVGISDQALAQGIEYLEARLNEQPCPPLLQILEEVLEPLQELR